MKRRVLSLLIAVALYSIPYSAAAVEYKVINLGTLGGIAAYGKDINDQGQIVGDIQHSWGYDAFVMDGTGSWRVLTRLAGSAHAVASNSSGSIVGYSTNENGRWHACVWNAFGNLTDLDSSNGSWANDINKYGTVAGYQEINGSAHASYWDNQHAITDVHFSEYLGRPISITAAYGINDSGQIVGHTWWGSGEHATIWDATGSAKLLESTPGWQTEAYSINSSGAVAGYIRTSISSGYQPCVWDAAGYLQVLSTVQGRFYSINDAGQAVGYVVNELTGKSVACYWDKINGLQVLDSPIGTSYSRAYAINSNGWIVGNADDNAVIWKPVPEPSSFLTLLCGLSGAGVLKLRKR